MSALAAGIVIAILLALIALYQADLAQRAQHTAEENASTATVAQGIAQNNEATAISERNRANVEAANSRSRELAVRSLDVLDNNNFDLAMLISLEAYHTADTFEALTSLFTALRSYPYLSTFLNQHNDVVRHVEFTPDGSALISGGRDQTLVFLGFRAIYSYQCNLSNWRGHLGVCLSS